jgi:hypothetical protein
MDPQDRTMPVLGLGFVAVWWICASPPWDQERGIRRWSRCVRDRQDWPTTVEMGDNGEEVGDGDGDERVRGDVYFQVKKCRGFFVE